MTPKTELALQDTVKTIHLYIAGVGNVGRAFVHLLQEQASFYKSEFRIQLQIKGAITTQKVLLGEVTETEVLAMKEKGNAHDSFSSFIQTALEDKAKDIIFIDNTASEDISSYYDQFLTRGISVVSCNKIACSSSFSYYEQLKQLAFENNCAFKYETAVGAALPVIKTIQNLRITGDKIHKIEAVLSGSLNFIFNSYDGSNSFASVVRRAMDEGYTEPNPLIDLSGVDVKRKLLILSREAGYQVEMSAIHFDSFLPKEALATSDTSELLEVLEQQEVHFKALYENALSRGSKLRVIAQLDGDTLKVGLQEVQQDSPFYQLSASDNSIALYTKRYKTNPLVIKGAGAGASVTASGVLADVMGVLK